MKICFINPTKMERPIYQVAKGMADRGHTSTILQPPGRWGRYPDWDNVHVIETPARYVPPINYTLPAFRRYMAWIGALIREQECDLIHAYDYQYPTAWIPLMAKHRYGIPVTITCNALVGIEVLYPNRFQNSLALLYSHTIGRLILRRYDRVIFLHPTQRNRARQWLGKNAALTCIPNGVSAEWFTHAATHKADLAALRRAWRLSVDRPTILCVGRLVPMKNFGMAIRIVERLIAEGIACHLLLVGDGVIRDELAKQAQAIGNHVTLTGHISPEQMPLIYALADVFLQTSTSEGSPAVVREAAASGLPVVASDVGGTTALINSGATGYLCDPHDLACYVEHLAHLLQDREARKNMGQLAAAHARTHFDWEPILNQYEALFEQVIGETDRAR